MIKLILRRHNISPSPGGTFDDVKIISETIAKNSDMATVIYTACQILNSSESNDDDILIIGDGFEISIDGDSTIFGHVQYSFAESKRTRV